MDASNLLGKQRVVPVVIIDDADTAVPLAECLLEAGLGSIEITLRTAAALDAIEQVAAKVPGMLVGAGSLRSPEHVHQVLDAGSRFAVSPGFTPELLDAAEAAGLAMLPGAATAAEMMQLLERGYVLQKFFPAELAGGVPYLKAVGAPLPGIQFVPTGGVSVNNAPDYLALANVTAVGGSWITPRDRLAARDFEGIGRLASDAAQLGM